MQPCRKCRFLALFFIFGPRNAKCAFRAYTGSESRGHVSPSRDLLGHLQYHWMLLNILLSSKDTYQIARPRWLIWRFAVGICPQDFFRMAVCGLKYTTS